MDNEGNEDFLGTEENTGLGDLSVSKSMQGPVTRASIHNLDGFNKRIFATFSGGEKYKSEYLFPDSRSTMSRIRKSGKQRINPEEGDSEHIFTSTHLHSSIEEKIDLILKTVAEKVSLKKQLERERDNMNEKIDSIYIQTNEGEKANKRLTNDIKIACEKGERLNEEQNLLKERYNLQRNITMEKKSEIKSNLKIMSELISYSTENIEKEKKRQNLDRSLYSMERKKLEMGIEDLSADDYARKRELNSLQVQVKKMYKIQADTQFRIMEKHEVLVGLIEGESCNVFAGKVSKEISHILKNPSQPLPTSSHYRSFSHSYPSKKAYGVNSSRPSIDRMSMHSRGENDLNVD